MSLDLEVWAIVMERFPKLEKERTCRLEKELRDAARMSFYKRLYDELRTTKILETEREDSKEL